MRIKFKKRDDGCLSEVAEMPMGLYKICTPQQGGHAMSSQREQPHSPVEATSLKILCNEELLEQSLSLMSEFMVPAI